MYKRPTNKQLALIDYIEFHLSGFISFKGVTRGEAGRFIRNNLELANEWAQDWERDKPGAGMTLNGL